MPENRKGTGKKAADTIKLKYTPAEIAAQKAAGGKVSKPGYFGYLKKHDPAKLAKIIAEREARRKAKT